MTLDPRKKNKKNKMNYSKRIKKNKKMQLPEELGRYVQSFLRPQKPLFYALQAMKSTPALRARMAELNLEFERKNWLQYYADHTDRTRFVIYSYTSATQLLHSPLPDRQRFAQRMMDATGELDCAHAATCEELHVEYSMLTVPLSLLGSASW